MTITNGRNVISMCLNELEKARLTCISLEKLIQEGRKLSMEKVGDFKSSYHFLKQIIDRLMEIDRIVHVLSVNLNFTYNAKKVVIYNSIRMEDLPDKIFKAIEKSKKALSSFNAEECITPLTELASLVSTEAWLH